MTTPLPSEPMPGDGVVPYMSTLVDRLHSRLPQTYRRFDAVNSEWPLKRYLGAILATGGAIDDTIEAIEGARPVGPAAPEPWALSGDQLASWRADRQTRPSALGDPMAADASWLPWMAQLVGAVLDPKASTAEQRDTIRYATSGWRAGTRGAIADAAKTALTGSQYARVVPHFTPTLQGGLEPARVWDITIVTRLSETPDPDAVLGAVLRKGVKPAGVVLWHSAYEATWDQIEAVYPTWADWEAAGSWDVIQEAGLMYRAVTGNLLANPSFEANTTGWTGADGATIGRVTGGIDGIGMLRVTAAADGTCRAVTSSTIAVTAGETLLAGASLRPDLNATGQLLLTFTTAADVVVSTVTVDSHADAADEWSRHQGQVVVPATAAKVTVAMEATGLASGQFMDIDAALLRRLA